MVERQQGSGSFRVSRSADQPDAAVEQSVPAPSPAVPPEAGGKQKPKGDEAVEIF